MEDVAAIEAALPGDGVTRIIHLKTMHLGPEELLVAAKIAVDAGESATEVARAIDAAERRVRAAVPIARVIYLEPDIYDAASRRFGRKLRARLDFARSGAGDATGPEGPRRVDRKATLLPACRDAVGDAIPTRDTTHTERDVADERLQGQGPLAGRGRPPPDPPRRARDARPDGAARGVRRVPAAQGRPHHGLAAHDGADRRADRDPHRARRPGALVLLQHLLDPGRGRRRDRGRPDRHARGARPARRSSPGRARRSRSTGGAPSRRSTGRPTTAPPGRT